MHVRVAISQKANEIDLPDTIKVIDYMIINNAMVLLVLGDFLYLDWLWAEVCGWFVCSHLSKNSVNTAVAFTHCQRAGIAAAEEEDGGTPPAAQPSVLNLDPSSYRFVAGANPPKK